jgi:hypothetical protein
MSWPGVEIIGAGETAVLAPSAAGAGFTANNMVELFARMGRSITRLHIHASALPLLGLPAALPALRPRERRAAHPFLVAGTGISPRSLAPWTTLGDKAIYIGAYQGQDGTQDPWRRAQTPEELLVALRMFQLAFVDEKHPNGWHFERNAITTGWELMRGAWRSGQRLRRLEQAGFNHGTQVFAEPELCQQVEIPYGSRWAHPRAARQQAPWSWWSWVHAFDVNGQRLSACGSNLQLGLTEVHRNRIGSEYDKMPGLFCIQRVENEPYGLPPALEPGWHMSRRVQIVNSLGVLTFGGDAYKWGRSIAYLQPFYERMRDARSWLLAERATTAEGTIAEKALDVALAALKQCYLQPLGRLRSSRLAAQGDLLYRPHWYDAVIGQELGRQYWAMHKLYRNRGNLLAVYFDAIITLDHEPDIHQSRVAEVLGLSDQLGKYKPVGTMPTSDALNILFHREDSTPDVGALMKAIKASPSPLAGEDTGLSRSAQGPPARSNLGAGGPVSS